MFSLRDLLKFGRSEESSYSAQSAMQIDRAAPDTTSSSAEANAKRNAERDLEARLAAYKRMAKKADKDGEFSESDEQAAEKQFAQNEAERTAASTPASLADLQKQVDELKVMLESQQRLVPENGTDNDVLTRLDARVVWAPSASLSFKVPENAVSNMTILLKRKDSPSLVVDDAVVIGYDTEDPPQPLWYLQIDDPRAVETH